MRIPWVMAFYKYEIFLKIFELSSNNFNDILINNYYSYINQFNSLF